MPGCELWALGTLFLSPSQNSERKVLVIGIVRMRKQAHRGKHSLSHVLKSEVEESYEYCTNLVSWE